MVCGSWKIVALSALWVCCGVLCWASSAVAQDANVLQTRVLIADQVPFAPNQSALGRSQRTVVELVARWLQSNPDVIVTVQGHADAGERRAQKLSEARAKAVRDHLTRRGVPAGRLKLEGLGAGDPASSDTSKRGREMNRRVEFKVIKEVSFKDVILFKNGTAVPVDTQPIDALARRLAENPRVILKIQGHADAREASEARACQELSLARARTVRQWLIKRGISKARLEVVGMGATRPSRGVDDRRVNFTIRVR